MFGREHACTRILPIGCSLECYASDVSCLGGGGGGGGSAGASYEINPRPLSFRQGVGPVGLRVIH